VDLRAVNRRVIESLIKCGAFDSLNCHRSRMMAGLDVALDAGQREQRDREVGQASMFDVIGEGESRNVIEPPLPDIPEWSTQERLSKEKETLGFYVTGHPLMRVQDQLQRLVTHDSSTLKDAIDLEHAVIAGIVSHVKRYVTKTKEQMAFITLEDLNGFIEIVVRPREWESRRELLESDEIIVIQGAPSQSDTQVKLVAEEILRLEDARRRFIKSVSISVSEPEGHSRVADSICAIFEKYKGNAPVQLVVNFPMDTQLDSVILDLSNRYKIDPCDDFAGDLKRLKFLRSIDYR
jgi:DNA polymerase III subunit alpha